MVKEDGLEEHSIEVARSLATAIGRSLGNEGRGVSEEDTDLFLGCA